MKKFIDYYKYIKSKEWREKSNYFKELAGFRCRICNGDQSLNSHHRTYENLGNETEDDITVLCRDCHELFSLRDKLPKPLKEEFEPPESKLTSEEKIQILKKYLYDLKNTNKYEAPIYIGFIDKDKEIKEVEKQLRQRELRDKLKLIAQKMKEKINEDASYLKDEFIEITRELQDLNK